MDTPFLRMTAAALDAKRERGSRAKAAVWPVVIPDDPRVQVGDSLGAGAATGR